MYLATRHAIYSAALSSGTEGFSSGTAALNSGTEATATFMFLLPE